MTKHYAAVLIVMLLIILIPGSGQAEQYLSVGEIAAVGGGSAERQRSGTLLGETARAADHVAVGPGDRLIEGDRSVVGDVALYLLE